MLEDRDEISFWSKSQVGFLLGIMMISFLPLGQGWARLGAARYKNAELPKLKIPQLAAHLLCA